MQRETLTCLKKALPLSLYNSLLPGSQPMQMKRHFTKRLSRSLQMFKNSTGCAAAQLLASVSMGPGRFLQFRLFIPLTVQRYSFFFPSFICCFIFFRQSCYVAQAGLTLGILLPQPSESWGYGIDQAHLALL